MYAHTHIYLYHIIHREIDRDRYIEREREKERERIEKYIEQGWPT